ncbi:glycosyltransferase family 4 protein [Eubacterium sp.]|uniref:glycosyltransferase family 4 protein n=1 Tax=Eubacterium sp. TaxID=142586 RepID=UPI003522CAA0
MKILIICNCATGLEVFRGMLIQELVKDKNDIYAVVPKTDEKKELDAESRIEKMNCELIRVPMERRGMNPIKDLGLLHRYYKIIKEVKPNLIITYTIKPNIYGGFAARILNVPYAVNITGLGTAFQGEGVLRHLVTVMYKIALKKAKIVFFENIENRDVIVNEGIIEEQKTHVLAGAGVDLEHFQYIEYPDNNGTTRFLFIGRVMKEKGIDELFTAMRKLNLNGYNCTLDVLGGFEENYSDKIEQFEKEGWLHYQGYQEDIRPFAGKCDCFVLPSWHEGMANTNLECAAMGRPVITSNIHGCMEAVEDGITGYLCISKNSDDLYDKMKNMCELLHEDKEKMGIKGRARMEEKFDKKKVVSETIRFMQGR